MWKNNVKLLSLAVFAALSLTVVSCGTKKNLVDATTSATKAAGGAKSAESRNLDFMRKVYDNEVYAKSISSKIKFTIATGSKDLSVSGSLRMKKDEVIRIQITPFGLMEAARIEFTKDYVLFMDRINKEYVKASYADVDFLKANGLDFYALQALFWNQLFVPGTQKITDSSLDCGQGQRQDKGRRRDVQGKVVGHHDRDLRLRRVQGVGGEAVPNGHHAEGAERRRESRQREVAEHINQRHRHRRRLGDIHHRVRQVQAG